jgi:hypothetical protein
MSDLCSCLDVQCNNFMTLEVSLNENYINNFIYVFLTFFYDFTVGKNGKFSDMFFLIEFMI